jgi:hypothetical protein
MFRCRTLQEHAGNVLKNWHKIDTDQNTFCSVCAAQKNGRFSLWYCVRVYEAAPVIIPPMPGTQMPSITRGLNNLLSFHLILTVFVNHRDSEMGNGARAGAHGVEYLFFQEFV